MKQRMKRKRGATFTIIVILSSALLLSVGGAFVESSRNLVTLAGLRDQKELGKEALAGAAEWSRCAVASGAVPPAAKLDLHRATVTVALRAVEGSYSMEATAHTLGLSQRARATIARRDGRWVIARFEFVDGAEKESKDKPEAPEKEKKFR